MTPPPLPPVQGGCMSGFTRAPFSKFKYSCSFLSLMFQIQDYLAMNVGIV